MLLTCFFRLFSFVAILAHRHARYSLVCFSYNSKFLLLHWFVFDWTTKKIEIYMYMPMWMCENKKLISLARVLILFVRSFVRFIFSLRWFLLSLITEKQNLDMCACVLLLLLVLKLWSDTSIQLFSACFLLPEERKNKKGNQNDSQEISSRSRCTGVNLFLVWAFLLSPSLSLIRCQRIELFSSGVSFAILAMFSAC